MSDEWLDIINDAGNSTLEEFADKASSKIKLTQSEIKELMPENIDHKQFAKLMSVVNDASKSNKQKADDIRNIAGFAEIAANLIVKLV